MVSKGKRRNLVRLYRQEGEFFTEDGKLCLKIGGYILRGLVPTSTDVKNDLIMHPFTINHDWDTFIGDPDAQSTFRPARKAWHDRQAGIDHNLADSYLPSLKTIYTDDTSVLKDLIANTSLYQRAKSAIIPPQGI